MQILLVYGTNEGHTQKIAAFVASHLERRGHHVTTANASDARTPPDPHRFDAVLVAASVHLGRYQAAVTEFVRNHRAAISARANGFLSVSLAAAGHDPNDIGGLKKCVADFVQATGWTPQVIHHVAGAFRYTAYRFLTDSPPPRRSRARRMGKAALLTAVPSGVRQSRDAATAAECYAPPVARFASRPRLIALIALLCQVGTAAHVPMVQARGAGHGNAAIEHCTERAQYTRGIDSAGTQPSDHLRHFGHPGFRGCGLCQCACAQAPALVPPPFVLAAAPHVPVAVPYRLPDVLQPASAFFRPPI
jgi:menaquinone-dependent protoporphyrinogen oxidase